ncbi:MAG TPA: hypothetical protein PK174_10385 [Anaerolineaceae bacterium]|nr:hypothetical protein [Anaerolineaceae bacterium]HQP09295.1 hypothetical protein [Anaerolineaceae bacterium]
MIDAFIRSILGDWGNAALDFYIANSLWINGIILLYALFVILAHRNYKRITNSVFTYLNEKYGSQLHKKGKGSLVLMMKKAGIPWNEIIKRSWIPFLAPPGSIRLYLSNEKTIDKLLPLEKIAELIQKKEGESSSHA